MGQTGIVRRIDDLGRVIIPKEIRRTLRIKENDPFELFTEGDDKIILCKYDPLYEIDTKKMWACVEAIFENTPFTVFNRDGIVVLTNSEGKVLNHARATSQDEFHVSAEVPERMYAAVRVIETFLRD